jgi:hypothetical protein
MRGRMFATVTVGLSVAGLAFLSLDRQADEEDRMPLTTRALEWLPSETAPVNRPVYLLRGDFILSVSLTQAIPALMMIVTLPLWAKLLRIPRPKEGKMYDHAVDS